MAEVKDRYDKLYYEYDPIKEQKDGKAAAAVIWSTKSINRAIEGIKKGLPLKANPFIGKNTKLLKPDLVFKRTEEEIKDYMRCMQDPIYFASKCFLMTPTGLRSVELRDYQVDYIKHLQNNRFSILLAARQVGKSVTTAIFCLWSILFKLDRNALILSKSGPAGRDLIKKIKDMYLYLPYHLKCGTLKWNQSEIAFDNNSTISTEAFSPTAGLGKTINFLILDEFAWCPPNDVELFYNNIIPTITTDSSANVCIMSTQNGFNLFYKLWHAAEIKENIYAPFKIDWWQVPNWDSVNKCWVKRDEKWKQDMVGVLGSEEAFYYQYGTQFSASDKCLVSRECLGDIRDTAKLFVKLPEDTPFITQVASYWSFKEGYDTSKMKQKYYVILVDLAEGGGGDYTIFNIIEIKDKNKYEQVGYWRSNKVDLEHAALEFWLMYKQMFDSTKALVSIEWNTYGALFYNYLIQLNERSYMPETSWRFNFVDEFNIECIIYYKKGSQEEVIAMPGILKNAKTIPGIRFTSANKKVACALLKMMIEKKIVDITDLVTISELENFEDQNGSGSYKAAYGHDDLIMTFCQLPMLENTAKFKDLMEDIEENRNKLKAIVAQNLVDIFPENLANSLQPIAAKYQQQAIDIPVTHHSRFRGGKPLTTEDLLSGNI